MGKLAEVYRKGMSHVSLSKANILLATLLVTESIDNGQGETSQILIDGINFPVVKGRYTGFLFIIATNNTIVVMTSVNNRRDGSKLGKLKFRGW